MSHRFVRCPHCKMPHDAKERVCPNTGLHMPPDPRSSSRDLQNDPARRNPRRSAEGMMGGAPPPERTPQPLGFNPKHDRVDRVEPSQASRAPAANARTGDSIPVTRDVQMELMGQTVGGRYLIKGVLGEGGMGCVYDAEHLGLGRQVAIKVLSPSQAKKRVAVKRFQQEARAAGAIGHPNICEVYDLGLLDDGSPYLVMEKLVGQTLAERIAKEGGMPFDEVIDVIVQVLSGLIAAHEKGIVHRDIKPENIFLARRLGCPPIIKLLDFGVSKMMPEFANGEEQLDLTRTGMVMGTPYYMSPEQARGERNLDGRVDVYACGVVMYEAIAGKRPFLAPNYNALLLAIINTQPRPLRDIRPKVPAELEQIIARAMAKSRADRYTSAKQFLRELTPAGAPAGVVPVIPVAEGSGSRLPLPPTAEERRRAQILGGGRNPGDSTRDRDRSARNLPPAAQSSKRDLGGSGGDMDRATRIEPRPSAPSVSPSPPSSRRSVPDVAPSADIPVDLEDPTEIFQPSFHRPPSQSQSPPSRRPHLRPPVQDWEGETVVKKPQFDAEHEAPPPPGGARPFNPDETLKLDAASNLELAAARRAALSQPPPPDANNPNRRRR